MPFSIGSDNAGVVSPAGQVALPSYIPPVAAPTATPTPTPNPTDQARIDFNNALANGNVPGAQALLPGGTAGYANPSTSPTYTAPNQNYAPGTTTASGVPVGHDGATSPTPSVQTSPSSPFDSDPGYYEAKSAEQLGLPSIDTNLQNLIAQRIVAYGDPALAAQAGFGIDPQAAAFARQNYLAGNGELARLDKAHDQVRRTIINTLAAHGLIDSGDTGYQIGNADQTYGNSVYDTQQQALADILGYRTAAQQQRDALHSAKTAALENAYQFAVDHPGAYGGVGSNEAAVAAGAPYTGRNHSGSPGDRDGLSTPSFAAMSPRQIISRQLTNPYATGRKRFG